MGPGNEVDLSDARLVAYLDGELSASEQQMVSEALMHDGAARDRLGALKRGGQELNAAFDVLLRAAPERRLATMYADVIADPAAARAALDAKRQSAPGNDNVVPLRPKAKPSGPSFWQMAAAAAILIFVFGGGLYTGGYFEPRPQVAENQLPGWREAAARYVALFSKDTLSGMPTDPQQRQTNLALVETALGLQLTGDRIAQAELEFQGTQLLRFQDKPLAQISYLHNGTTPVALCIIKSANPAPKPPEVETRQGMNIVHWVTNGYGFMVIGGVPQDELSRIAQGFQAKLS